MPNLLQAFANPAQWLRERWISPADIRAEVWALGVRHRGHVLDGARQEAASATNTARRAVLLKAVIRDQNILRRSQDKQSLLGQRGGRP